VHRWEVQGSSGGPDAPLPEETIYAKFRSLADPVIGSEQAAKVIEVVNCLEALPDIHDLTRLLIPPEHKRKQTAPSTGT